MTSHKSRFQLAIEDSSMSYDLSIPHRRPSSAPMVASQGNPYIGVSTLVNNPASSVPERLYSPGQYSDSPPLAMTEPSAQWPEVLARPNFYQQTCSYRAPQELYRRQYEHSMTFSNRENAVDEPTWAYSFPPDCSLASPTSTRPRSYTNGLIVDASDSMGTPLEAYPPAAYHLDLQKHQPYLNISTASLFQNGMPLDQNSGTPTQIFDGSNFRDDLYQDQSPTPSYSSTPSYRVDKEPTVSPPPVEGYEGVDMARFKDEETDGECSVNEEPYAKLIYRALMSVPERKMVLKEIYEWFELNTDKAKNTSSKGWQNSIRHNLSMNGAFKKVDQLPPCDESKKGFIWVLEPSAIQGGVKSTTRYRKTVPNKKSYRSENPAPRRQQSGSKGGKAARKAAKMRRSARNEEIEGVPMVDRAAGGMMTIPRSSLHDHTRPTTPMIGADTGTSYSPFANSMLGPSQQLNHEPYNFEDIVGCVNAYPDEPLFRDSSDDFQGSVAPDYRIESSIADPFFCSHEY
ncbi:MAG: hypothetical protein M1812_004396 [Candelaria pacifica]|nr:MAG: hypothetical protein M1812_004396 [Candelaria pacifica]